MAAPATGTAAGETTAVASGVRAACAGSAASPATVQLELSADASVFDKDTLAGPKNCEPFRIRFTNKEGIAHNVGITTEIYGQGERLFRGENIVGPETIVYSVEPLPSGRYHFVCDVHWKTQIGILTVGSA